jgi:hypothetical protein
VDDPLTGKHYKDEHIPALVLSPQLLFGLQLQYADFERLFPCWVFFLIQIVI